MKKNPPVYMVLVYGRGEPKILHATEGEAMSEAKRLAKKEYPRAVYVLEIKHQFAAEMRIKKLPLPLIEKDLPF